MTSPSVTPAESARTRLAAVLFACFAISYSALTVYYFYEDFFKYLGDGAVTTTDRTGWLVSVDGAYLWTILSPWRLLAAALAVAMLGVSAHALWTNRPKARALSLITIWGVVFPQFLWYTEFVADWHNGAGLTDIILAALVVAAIPTALLVRRHDGLVSWQTEWPHRLLGLAIACAWIGFGATEFIDHAYVMDSCNAYMGALIAIPLAALAVRGVYMMRTWALWAGVGSAIALAMVPFAAASTRYVGTGGHIDDFHAFAASSDLSIAVAMVVPLALVWITAAPYLHAFVRKLRD